LIYPRRCSLNRKRYFRCSRRRCIRALHH
jgi:hypothetical protein